MGKCNKKSHWLLHSVPSKKPTRAYSNTRPVSHWNKILKNTCRKDFLVGIFCGSSKKKFFLNTNSNMKKKTYPKICERTTGRSGSEAEVRWRRSRRRKHKMAASASAKRKHKMAASASARRKMVGRFSEAFSPCNTNNKENPFKKKKVGTIFLRTQQ